MRFNYSVVLLLLIAPTHAQAQNQTVSNQQTVQGDPYESHEVMKLGKWAGKPIDMSTKRPAYFIEEDSQQISFANFRNQGTFHRAHVRLDGIGSVYFRINRFGTHGIAHTLLYFKMKPGSEINLGAPQNSEDFSNSTLISEFVVSLDYTAPAGVKYSLAESTRPNYMAVMDFRSAADYASRGEDPKYLVEYLKLNLDDKEMSKLLTNAVHRSDEQKFDYAYSLTEHDCTTEAFKLLDESVNYSFAVQPFKLKLRNWKDIVAGASEKALSERGLIQLNDDGSMPALWANKDGFLPEQQ